MIRSLLPLAVSLIVSGLALAQPKDAIKKVEASFDPPQAKPGQTVTLKLTVELAEGYFTYPVIQPAPEAKYSVNQITFPAGGPLVFVGETVDPVEPKVKKAEDHEYLIHPGGGTWIRKAVVRPTAAAGEEKMKVKFRIMVCDEDRCFPPKAHDLEATLKIQDGPAVPVEARYKDDVEKAGKK